MMLELQRFVFICRACLRLTVNYVEEVYPSKLMPSVAAAAAAAAAAAVSSPTSNSQHTSPTTPGQEDLTRFATFHIFVASLYAIPDTWADISQLIKVSIKSLIKFGKPEFNHSKNGVGSKSSSSLVVTAAPVPESPKLAECIFDVRSLLQQILSDASVPELSRSVGSSKVSKAPFASLAEAIWEDAHRAFVACFHAFYPSGQLKWNVVCQMLSAVEMTSALSASTHDNDTSLQEGAILHFISLLILLQF